MPDQATVYGAMEDRDLVIAFKAGEPGAYNEMYRRYSARVAGICRRMLGNREDAQEAVQETFLKAYVALPQFNGNYRLGAWLSRIASNVCLDALRVRSRVATVVPLHGESAVLGVETSPEDVVVGDSPDVAGNIADIQPLHARALVMRGVEGLSHREMAGRLAMTPAQVKALLHRARRSFKRSWDEAKGFALAPLLALRGWSRQARGAASSGSQLAGAAAGLSPLVAERVAASAVIVAVALSGVHGVPTPAAAASTFGHRPLRAIERQLAERRTLTIKSGPRAHRADAPGARSSLAGAVLASSVPQESLTPGLARMLNRTTRVAHRSKQRTHQDKNGIVPSLGSVAPGDTVKHVGKKLHDLIPPR